MSNMSEKAAEIITDAVRQIPADGYRAMVLMDSEDEKAIVKAELLDETVKSLVYMYGNNQLTLTINGVFEACRRYKNIRTGITKIEKTSTGYLCYAYAENMKDNIRVELAVEQPFKIQERGAWIEDKFALQKAQSKAIRNCVRKVIPINYFQTMIKKYIDEQKKKIVPKTAVKQ